MNFTTLVMQLLSESRRTNANYTVDNAIADAVKIKQAYQGLVDARVNARNARSAGRLAGAQGGITGRAVQGGVVGISRSPDDSLGF